MLDGGWDVYQTPAGSFHLQVTSFVAYRLQSVILLDAAVSDGGGVDGFGVADTTEGPELTMEDDGMLVLAAWICNTTGAGVLVCFGGARNHG